MSSSKYIRFSIIKSTLFFLGWHFFFVRFLIKIRVDLGEKNEIEVIELQHSLSCISKTILVRSQSKYPLDRILHSAWDMQVSFITCTHIGLELILAKYGHLLFITHT